MKTHSAFFQWRNLIYVLPCLFDPGLQKTKTYGCHFWQNKCKTYFAYISIRDKVNRGFSSISNGIFVTVFFIYIGLSANVRLVPIDGLGLKLDTFFVHEFPKLILFFIVLYWFWFCGGY